MKQSNTEVVQEILFSKDDGSLILRRSDGSVIARLGGVEPEPEPPTVVDSVPSNHTLSHPDTPFVPFAPGDTMGDEVGTKWFIAAALDDALVQALTVGAHWRMDIDWGTPEWLLLETTVDPVLNSTDGYWTIVATVVDRSAGWDALTGGGPATLNQMSA